MATTKAKAFIHQNLAKPQPSPTFGMTTTKGPSRPLDTLMGQHLSEDPHQTGSDLVRAQKQISLAEEQFRAKITKTNLGLEA